MNAPIDIIISIIKRKENEVLVEPDSFSEFNLGKKAAYEDLINEFEGFKKLFN